MTQIGPSFCNEIGNFAYLCIMKHFIPLPTLKFSHGLLFAASLTLSFLSSVTAHAQDELPVLKVLFANGSSSLIEMTAEMRFEFTSDVMRIFPGAGGDDREFILSCVSRFMYESDRAAADAVAADSDPVIRFSADGLTVHTSGGHHSCRVYSADGAIVLSEEFDSTLFIPSASIPSGAVLIQIDRNKVLKLMKR